MLSVLLTASATFLISSHYLKKTPEFVPVPNQTDPSAKGEKLQYFSDEIILASKNQNDKNRFVLNLELNRKEVEKGKFIHYYTARFFQNGKEKTVRTNFYSNTEKITKNAFLPKYENAVFDDLSTRESFAFALSIDGKTFDITTTGLEGDFITKNDITYTRYLSEGKGTVKIGGEKFEANAALEKVYSSDHSKYLFFPGVNDLTSRTYRFLVWNSEGNFYLLDNSIVSKDHPAYRPHTWILYKNAAPKYLQKFFEAQIKFAEKGKEKNWEITIPGLETKLLLKTTDPTDVNWSNGTVGGVANTKAGEKTLYGAFSYKKE